MPPDQRALFGGVIEAFGVFALMVIWINRKKLALVAVGRITEWAVRFCIACALSLVVYLILYRFCVVSDPYRGTVIYPLWVSGDLAEMVSHAGGRQRAFDYYGLHAIDAATKNTPIALAVTTIVLLLFYQSILSCLSVAFGLLAITPAGLQRDHQDSA